MKQTPEPKDKPVTDTEGQLFGSETMREQVWPFEKDRPSGKTVERLVKQKIIPSIKIGHRRWFNIPTVKAALLARQVGGIPTSNQNNWRNN